MRLVGSIHGILWILLCLCPLQVLVRGRLFFKWCVITFLCALVPFAPFFLDRKLRERKALHAVGE